MKKILTLFLLLSSPTIAQPYLPWAVPTGMVSVICNRTSGVAPLAVICSAEAVTAAGVTSPYSDIQYKWEWGDPAGSTWTYGTNAGGDKNVSYGLIGGHVYDPAPGSGTQNYTLTVSAYTGGATQQQTFSISVTDPTAVFATTETICLTTGSDFTGCPASATQVGSVTDFGTEITNRANADRRLLFRRGDTFTSAAAGGIIEGAVGLIGAYGSGSKPIFTGGAFTSIRFAAGVSDWRIQDITFAGSGSTSGVAISTGGGSIRANQITVLRADATNVQQFVNWDGAEWAVHDSTATTITGKDSVSLALYPNASFQNATGTDNWMTVQGNDFTGGGVASISHVIRAYVPRYVIANNDLRSGGTDYNVITVRTGDGVSYPTNYGQISDNKITPSAGETQPVEIKANVSYLIYERNFIVGGGSTFKGTYTTVRNNISNLTTTTGQGTSFAVVLDGSPTPTNMQFLNNTSFRNDAYVGYNGVYIDASAINITAKNNICSGPNTTSSNCISGTGTGTPAISNNSSPSDLLLTGWLTTYPPVTTADYKPDSGYPIAGGTAVTNWTDFFRISWQPTWDTGAVKH